MLRKEFIRLSALGILSTSGIPLLNSTTSEMEFNKDELMGLGKPTLYGDHYRLRKEAHKAFVAMRTKAKESGIIIQVISSYRDYHHQKRIWERKYKNFIKRELTPSAAIDKIITYSTIPGTSRHHWATDLDIIDGSVPRPKNVLNEKHFKKNAAFYKFKRWMDIHANNFGFYLVYTNAPNRKGFNYEPWHYSYAPLSIPMLKAYRKLEIKREIQNSELSGCGYFTDLFIDNYQKYNILDINHYLL